jgi:hypothetical protein
MQRAEGTGCEGSTARRGGGPAPNLGLGAVAPVGSSAVWATRLEE